ncbi:MAG: glycosyltransferase family 2 protein [Methylococcaceae bacterium]|nr:glycosyltransferase family 2 protein [Methylococcaceae bacterium]
MKFSIIIPTLNEATNIQGCLIALQALRNRAEIIVVDGGSRDNTVALATPYTDKILLSVQGRATQMNHGAKVASGDILIFLHADTKLPEHALLLIEQGISAKQPWGRFAIQLRGSLVPTRCVGMQFQRATLRSRPQCGLYELPRSAWELGLGESFMLKVIAFMMNWRSRLTGIATGDQVLFVSKAAFIAVGCYPEISLMEDIALSRALKKISPPVCLTAKVISSARRWQQYGICKTILLMWSLRLRYWLGADPTLLTELYRTGTLWKR